MSNFIAHTLEYELDDETASDSTLVFVYDILLGIVSAAEACPGHTLGFATQLFSMEDVIVCTQLLEEEIERRSGVKVNRCPKVH